MNYQKIYNQIIDRARKENRQKTEGGTYYERHHIIPRCLGGSDSIENLILLTAREHFICHWILFRIYPENVKLAKAFNAMCILQQSYQYRYVPSSRAISEAKESINKLTSGVPQPLEAIKKRTATRRERDNYRRTRESVIKGIETRKERGSYKGRKFTAEHLDNLAKAHEKPIQQINLEGEVVAFYKSLSKASASTNLNISGISRAATGKSKTYKGFIWKYV